MMHRKEYRRPGLNDSIDLGLLFFRISKYWPFFLGCVIFFLILALLFNRNVAPVYKVSSTILIKEEVKQSVGNSDILQELQMFSGGQNIQNEIGILESYSLSLEVLKKMGNWYSVSKKKRIYKQNMYPFYPFVAEVDTTHAQLVDYPVDVELNSDGSFSLSFRAQEDIALYDYTEGRALKKIDIEDNSSINLKEGEWYETEWMRFRLFQTEKNDEGNEYILILNNIDRLAQRMSSAMQVEPVSKGASLVSVSVKGNNPRWLTDYINTLSQTYILSDLQEKNQKASNTIDFIDIQLNEISDSLQWVENKLQEFRTQKGIMDLGYQATSVLERLDILEREKAVEQVKSSYYSYLVDFLKKGTEKGEMITPSSMGIEDPSLNLLVEELNKYYAEKREIGTTAGAQNPYLASLEEKISGARRSLEANLENIVQHSDLSLKELNGRIVSVQKELKRLPASERELVNIKRNFAIKDQVFSYLLQKRAEAAIARASNIPNHRVVDAAVIEGGAPVFPRRLLTYLIALGVGIILPFILVLLKESLDGRIRSREELVMLSDIPLSGLIAQSSKNEFLPVIDDGRSLCAESFRTLRSNLRFIAQGPERKMIAISSSMSGEGKTFCAANLAAALAVGEKKTIIVGCDLRKPDLPGIFGMTDLPGLSQYLIGKAKEEEIIHKTRVDRLDIISPGLVPPNPAELLESDRLKDLLLKLREQYDRIVLDTPPLGSVSDALRLLELSDIRLMILRANYSKRVFLHAVNELKENTSLPNISLVLNDVKRGRGMLKYSGAYAYGMNPAYEVPASNIKKH